MTANEKALHRDPFFDDPEFAQFYDCECGSDRRQRFDFEFCMQLAEDAGSVLDLGCGTGELAAAISNGRDVTGIDPANAMLEIARKRCGGDGVTWIEADARTLRLDDRFDLVLLTGHAFQVFLTREDQQAALATIALHLSPGGCVVFDTRNPIRQA